MIRLFIFPLTVWLFMGILSCREMKNKEVEAVPPSLQSTRECHNVIKVWLDGGKQFRAVISSDIPIFDGVEFAGYYAESETHLMLSGITGGRISLRKKNGIYVKIDVSFDQALLSGWVLAPEKRSERGQ
jgi:hypothetical protein